MEERVGSCGERREEEARSFASEDPERGKKKVELKYNSPLVNSVPFGCTEPKKEKEEKKKLDSYTFSSQN